MSSEDYSEIVNFLSTFDLICSFMYMFQLFASIEPILLTENVNKMPEHSDETDESNMVCLFYHHDNIFVQLQLSRPYRFGLFTVHL
jgi:hypothetical protein